MTHHIHTTSNDHKELDTYGNKYLEGLVTSWADPFPKPVVSSAQTSNGALITVVRDDVFEWGTKARAAEAVLSQPEYKSIKTLVYIAPRSGWAAISLAAVAKRRGLRLILLCPAARELSRHQQAAYELGAELWFVRVAAMQVMAGYGKALAMRLPNAVFLPLGLALPAAVAGLAKVAKSLNLNPKRVWCVASTGTLTRALQLAWPQATHTVVAVARNLHAGEKGIAGVWSHDLPFLRDAPLFERPPYPSAVNYDAKAWLYVDSLGTTGDLIWNVAGEPVFTPTRPLPNSHRDWGDLSDLHKN